MNDEKRYVIGHVLDDTVHPLGTRTNKWKNNVKKTFKVIHSLN